MKKVSKTQDTQSVEESGADDHSAGSGSYQVVARRYRPKVFEELVGQNHIAQALSNALTSGRVGHAYLFTGARGVGKTSTARIFAKSLNCVQGPTLTPCGVCDSCQSVSVGEDVDVLEIDGASNRGVDEIRQLRQNASICPSRSRFKIYIIDEVHMLTREAFNALLKTLEEPPEHVKFIFCTTEPQKLPITILSRCQRYDFAGIDVPEIAARLASIASNEGITADDGVFQALARRAAGSMRDAQSLLEQLLSFAPEHISVADVHEMLGTANDQLLFRLLDALLNCEPATIFKELETAASEGVDFGVLVEQFMDLLRDLLVVSSGGGPSLLLSCMPSQFDRLRKLAEAFGLHRILAALQILDQTHARMRYSTKGRVLTELALVRIAHLDHFQMISVLLDKLREGHLPVQLPSTGGSPVQLPKHTSKSPTQTLPESSVTASSTTPPSIKSAQRSITPPKQEVPPSESMLPVQTPQERFAAASVPQPIDLVDIDDKKASEIWYEAADATPGMLGTSASQAIDISFEKPAQFIVVFENKSSMDFCQRESARLQNTLCQALGKSVRIRFELNEEKKKDAMANDSMAQNQLKTTPGELFKIASESSMVRQIESVFGFELFDVK